MGHDPPQRRQRTVISFRDVMISGPFSQSEDGELQIEGVLEGDLTCHALIVPPGGTVKGTIRADWVVIQGNFCGNVETSVFTATKDAVVIGGRITVYEKVLIEPECLFRGELQRPGEGDASPARGFARSAAVAESDRLAAETMASWSFTEGDTALVEAIVKGDSKIAGRLLLAGADPNAAAPEGMTALTLAAANLRVEIAELLLGAGADPDLRTAEDETPLLLACDRGAQRLVEVLLAGGADPSAARADGSTPLIEATRRGRTEIVRALLLAGADLEERNSAGEVPMVLAKERGYEETLVLLRQAAVGDLAPIAEDDVDDPAEANTDQDGPDPDPLSAEPLPAGTSAAPDEPAPAGGEAQAAPTGAPAEPAAAEATETDPGPPVTEEPPAEAQPEPDDPEPAEASSEVGPEDRSHGESEAAAAPDGPPPDPIVDPAPMATAPAQPQSPPPIRRSRKTPRPKESAESVLADLAPAAPPAEAEFQPGADGAATPESGTEAAMAPEASPEPEAPLVAQVGPDLVAAEPEFRIEGPNGPDLEADPPAAEAEPVLDIPSPNGAGDEASLPVPDPKLDAARTPTPPETSPQSEPDIRDEASPEPYLRMPEPSPPPAPQPVAEAPDPARTENQAPDQEAPETEAPKTEAPEQVASATESSDTEVMAPEVLAPEVPAPEVPAPEVLAPEEVEDLSRRLAQMIAPFSLDEARAPLPDGEAEDQPWEVTAQGEGLAASATRPDPDGREAILVKYGAGGALPGQIELRVRGIEANGAPESQGELLLSLFGPDESLVYWPVGFRRLVLRDGEGAVSYACDEDGNWSKSDDPAEY